MPHIETVLPNTDFPKQADAVVIGAGIIGISTALELAERGLSVVVIEKGEVAAEQSSRNWGWVRQMGRDAREIPLIKQSMGLWRGMNARVNGETGFQQCGIAYMDRTEAEAAVHEAWLKSDAAPYGLSSRMITAQQLSGLVPASSRAWVGAMYTPDDCRAEPFLAVPAMARGLQAKGGLIFTQCAARGIETAGGKASAVITERGRIITSRVVLAGGYWSRRFLHNNGIAFPQLGVVNSVLRTEAFDAGTTTTFSGNDFAVRKRQDGGFTIAHNRYSVADIVPDSFWLFFKFLPMLAVAHEGLKLRLGKRFIDEATLARRWAMDEISPFEKVRVMDPAPVQWILDQAMASLKKDFPIFEGVRVAESWGGLIDATPDAVPVISALAKIPGLFLASGFSGHGFGLGPGAGKLMAELMLGEAPSVDPTPFRFERFSDGSRPRPTTGL